MAHTRNSRYSSAYRRCASMYALHNSIAESSLRPTRRSVISCRPSFTSNVQPAGPLTSGTGIGQPRRPMTMFIRPSPSDVKVMLCTASRRSVATFCRASAGSPPIRSASCSLPNRSSNPLPPSLSMAARKTLAALRPALRTRSQPTQARQPGSPPRSRKRRRAPSYAYMSRTSSQLRKWSSSSSLSRIRTAADRGAHRCRRPPPPWPIPRLACPRAPSNLAPPPRW